MTQSLTLTRFEPDDRTIMGRSVACRQLTPAADVVGRAAASGTPAPLSGRTGADDYEVTVTLRVNGAHIEDVVARSFADPCCVDIQVQNATLAQRIVEEGSVRHLDDQASRWARLYGRARSEAPALRLTSAPVCNDWDEV